MEQFLESLRRDGLRMAEVVGTGPLDAEIRGCPGWTLADLARHMGFIHRWVVRAVETRSAPPNGEIAGPPGTSADALGQWLAEGVLRLVRTLEAQEPDAPTWHPFDAPQMLSVWPRRQAHETL